jgi:hypothetical protein
VRKELGFPRCQIIWSAREWLTGTYCWCMRVHGHQEKKWFASLLTTYT